MIESINEIYDRKIYKSKIILGQVTIMSEQKFYGYQKMMFKFWFGVTIKDVELEVKVWKKY